MSGRYFVLPAADRDLDDQATHLAAEASLEVALRFYQSANITFGKIARMSGIGEPWPSNDPRLSGLRVLRVEGFEKHLIFYRAADHGIEIVRVIHASRDINHLLESEQGL